MARSPRAGDTGAPRWNLSVSRRIFLQRGTIFPLTATDADGPGRRTRRWARGARGERPPPARGQRGLRRRGGRRCPRTRGAGTGRAPHRPHGAAQRPSGPARAGDARPHLPLGGTEPRPARRRRSAPPRASSASSWRPRGGGGRARPLSRRNAPSRPAGGLGPAPAEGRRGEGGGKGKEAQPRAAAARYASSRSAVRRAQPRRVPASRPRINGRGGGGAWTGLRMRAGRGRWGRNSVKENREKSTFSIFSHKTTINSLQ